MALKTGAMADLKFSFAMTRINYNLKYIRTVILKCNIPLYCCFTIFFDQINAPLVSIKKTSYSKLLNGIY